MARKSKDIMRKGFYLSKEEGERWEKEYTPPHTKNRDKIRVEDLDSNVVKVLEATARAEIISRKKYRRCDIDLATACLKETNGNVKDAIEKLNAYKRTLWQLDLDT